MMHDALNNTLDIWSQHDGWTNNANSHYTNL